MSWRRRYVVGLEFLGDAGSGEEFGPLSPEQLANLDRALTPEEQAAVMAWQSAQADAELAAERSKGGPQSETVSVTPQGAVIRAAPQPALRPMARRPPPVRKSAARPKGGVLEAVVPGVERPLWQVALAALGVIGVGLGAYQLFSSRDRRAASFPAAAEVGG